MHHATEPLTNTPPSVALAPEQPAPRAGRSIARRLPLVMSVVLAAVLATSLVLTYRTLANTARAAATTRLAEVARIIASTVEQSTRVRYAQIVSTAHDSAVVRALRVAANRDRLSADDESAARAAIAGLALPTDSGLPLMLWTADGRQIVGVGSQDVPIARPELPTLPPAVPVQGADSVHTGAAYVIGSRIYYQQVAPVSEHGRRLGYVVLQRRIGNNTRLASQLRALTGEDVVLFLHQRGSRVWASLTGTPTAAPDIDESPLVLRAEGGPRLTSHASIAGTPWTVTLEEPLAAVLRRPRAVLRDLALLSAILTLAGAAASWLIGRRIARPLVQLTGAAEAIARGDYASRVAAHGEDEVARLAHTFNAMAGEVESSQRALGRQYSEARAVAAELEAANERLQDAMHAVEEARDAAEHANRAKSDFLAVMSHELRTPLNAIGGYAELMQLGIYGTVTAEQTHALTRITRSQQHLLALINDVLNFAKLNAAKVQFDIRDVPVIDALAAVEPMVAPQLVAKSLRFTPAAGDPSLTVRADREKLQQIVLNLLSNAVKFTPEGGSVSVSCVADDATVRVEVRDSGIGIPAERLQHVFEPFVQVDRALNRPHEGVGLGLAISHDLALGMNGTLTAESAPGEGSTFALVLPRGGVSTTTPPRGAWRFEPA